MIVVFIADVPLVLWFGRIGSLPTNSFDRYLTGAEQGHLSLPFKLCCDK